MSFQIKIFITFALVMVILFSVMNFITIYFFQQEQQRYEKEIKAIYDGILKRHPNYPLPPHIKKFGSEIEIEKSYYGERFTKYSKTVLIWEALLLIVLSYLFFKVLNFISKKEKEYEEFLKFLFFLLSHKIGNFLSVMKTNLEILRLKPEPKVLERIERSCILMDEELKKSIETAKKLPKISKSKQKVNLNELLKKLLTRFNSDKKIILTSRETLINTNAEAIETIIFLLLDNAFRYAHSKVHIKMCKEGIAVRNDFSEIIKGSGIGLQIVEYLCRLHGFSIIFRAKEEHFLVILRW